MAESQESEELRTQRLVEPVMAESQESEVEESYYYRFRLRCLAGVRKHKHLLAALILGQLLSLLLCGTGVTSQLLEDRHSIAVPTSQAFINYALLAAVFGTTLATSGNFIKILKYNWWKYAILGMIDVEANYLIILAYKYTNLTSVQLLDSFSLATVMLLSYIFLRVRYKVVNIMGVLLCLIGIATLVLADRKGSRLKHGSNPLLGDMLCLIGSVLYAISNVAQEYLVKNHTVTEYLGLIGVSGTIVSAVQLVLLERPKLVKIDWNTDIGLLFGGFGVSLFLFYSAMPYAMRYSSAVVVNLSLLTADIYSLLFGLYVFHYKFSLFYILALILIVAGVFIFNLNQPVPASQNHKHSRHKKHEVRPHIGKRLMEEVEDQVSALLESQSLDLSTSSRISTISRTSASSRTSACSKTSASSRTSISSRTSAVSSYGSNDETENPLRGREGRV